jgi:hypothetical protein
MLTNLQSGIVEFASEFLDCQHLATRALPQLRYVDDQGIFAVDEPVEIAVDGYADRHAPKHLPAQVDTEWDRCCVMDVVRPRCAESDCSKPDANVCVRIQGQRRRAKSTDMMTWGATAGQILALREHLVAGKVTCVVIESNPLATIGNRSTTFVRIDVY